MYKAGYAGQKTGASGPQIALVEKRLREKYPMMYKLIKEGKWGKKKFKTARTQTVEKQAGK
jgi:hypothetical protein